VALCLGANNILENTNQYKLWIAHWLPHGHIVYTFCMAAICWAIWKRRNEVFFENKTLRHPTDIILYACALMTYWAGLYGSDMQGKILDGVKILISCVHKVMAQQRSFPLVLCWMAHLSFRLRRMRRQRKNLRRVVSSGENLAVYLFCS